MRKKRLGPDKSAGEKTEGTLLMNVLRSQERAMRVKDIEAGRLIPSSALRGRLGISPQALGAAVRTGRIFFIAGPDGQRLYPAFFADTRYDRQELEKVSQALADLSGSIKWAFFMTPKRSLAGKRPLDAIPKRMQRVLCLAQGLVEE